MFCDQKRELKFCNGYLSLLYFWPKLCRPNSWNDHAAVPFCFCFLWIFKINCWWWWFQSIFHCIANWQDGFLKQFLVYWSTFIPRFVSSKISFVLGGIRFRFRLTDETLTHFLSFPSIQVNNCQKVSFCLFHCINRWLKTIFEISLFLFLLLLQFKKEKGKEETAVFELEQEQKSKQKKLVFHICFVVTGWCNETNII